jgi:hypothetical protein
MQFYTFGDQNKPSLLLLPGTCCHWKKNFGPVIDLLVPYFYVICVSYDGFDETEDSIFPNMIKETEKIEDYIQNNLNGKLFAAYGCSLGGSFAGLLLQRKQIHIVHAILGSSDLDQAKKAKAYLQAKIVAPYLHRLFHKKEFPGWMQKRINKAPAENQVYMNTMMKMFGIGSGDMAFVKKESIFNQFYSDLITPLQDQIEAEGSTVHIFYAVKMGEEYEKRYLQHFKNPDLRRHDLQHEELLVCYPEKWVQEICSCCRISQKQPFEKETV